MSRNGLFRLDMQEDGNLVLSHRGSPIWWSETTNLGEYLHMHANGNLVINDENNNTLRSSNTRGLADYLEIQNDGNLVIFDAEKNSIATTNSRICLFYYYFNKLINCYF